MTKRDRHQPAGHTPPNDAPASDSFAGCGRDRCPSLQALEAEAVSGDGSTLMPGCSQCRRRLEAVRANQALLSDLLPPGENQSFRAPANAADQPPIDTPPELHGYTILEPISAGGQATVYRAIHDASKRMVAIKVMHGVTHDPLAASRIERELQILARLRHPGIVTVHDGGWTSDALPYIVMEFIEGGTLREHAAETRFYASRAGIRAAAELTREIAEAVAAAQRTGLIHRDLKPGNILIDEQAHPKVADFGVAREREANAEPTPEPDHKPREEPAREFVGSIAYAAPEQFDPDAVVDARVDVFSLGLILRELVVGHRLRRDPLRSDAAPSARAENQLLPADLDRIITRATAINPADRYAGAAELADDLARWLNGYPIRERESDGPHALALFARRHPIAVTAALLFIATLVVYAVGITSSAALIRAQNIDLEQRLKQREAVMSAMSEPIAAIDSDASLVSVRDINELLLRAADAIEQHLDDEPALQSRLLTRVGQALLYRREYDRAERCLTKANDIEEQLSNGTPTPRLGETLHDLGRLAWHRSTYDRASAREYLSQSVALYERAHAVRDAVLPPACHELALTMSHLGSAYSSLGRFNEADAMFAEVLPISEANAERAPLELVRTMMSIGSHRYRRNDLEGSEHAFARAEEAARRAAVGLPLASAINARGLLLLELNRPDDAIEKFNESAELRRSLLGHFDADYLASRRDLALALLEADRPEDAHAVASAIIQSLPLAGDRARGVERVATFILLASEARRTRSGNAHAKLRDLWQTLIAQPRIAETTDRRLERLRASLGLELAAAIIAANPSGPAEELQRILTETELDLQSLVPSPRQRRDLERLRSLNERAGTVIADDTI